MIIKSNEIHCPLCRSKNLNSFFKDKKRIYLRCFYCKLVFVPKQYWINAENEKKNYDLHKNDSNDQGYRQFLSRLSTPILEKINSKQQGLDFGCGPGPTLSVMLEEQGIQTNLYDPFYHNDPSVFYKKYDFITATEVVEHLHDPYTEFTALFKMLKKGGWLGIMTKLVINKTAFSQWHYIRDMTHICFYSRSTFEYIAQRFNAELNFISNDVILLNKK
ncbi:class I SAM-dependent methyltransferase [Desulfobacula phenolica]|uniref:Methyltransferase domain-containing protein n=1 Tax=Desulfobacula phenolica TaxID=90732 RepID=A0A1H2GET9_9BACT|nr:class I SAM-dependent methyltransferase [Desulfobacula phenolica]SDU17918.1 Methyltransferase domain-containing protein [Desulfobacula phenolica]